MLIIIFLLCVFLIIVTLLFSIFFVNSFFTSAPFVPVKKRVLKKIIESLKLTPKSTLYDLGCGDGRVLIDAVNTVGGIKAVGVEKNIIVCLWAKWRARRTNIKIYCNDFSQISLKEATHIYLYLYPELMDKILVKIKKECAPGTRIVSCSFTFSDLVPCEVIDLPVARDKMCKKLYVYILN